MIGASASLLRRDTNPGNLLELSLMHQKEYGVGIEDTGRDGTEVGEWH